MNDFRGPGSQIIIDNKFDELMINKKIKSSLKTMNMIDMTPIQSKCIPHLLEDKDLLGAAKTGSGKTLAFLVPLIEKIMKEGVTPEQGTLGIILSPTRELSMQTFKVLEELIDETSIKAGVVIGGNNRDEEARHISQGVNVLVATPGRLLDHLNSTKPFNFSQMHTLIIDEADRLMSQGFLEEMRAIIKKLPKNRQTVLFSATLNITSAKLKKAMKALDKSEKKKKLSIEDKVLALACFSLKENCVCVDLSMNDSRCATYNKLETSTVSQLSQKYVLCDDDERFKILYSLLKSRQNEKVMVFMSTCLEVQFYYKLLKFINEDDINSTSVLALHGQQKQWKREENFEKFKNESRVILLCTDIAARGLDVPHVDLVIQYDPPDDHKEYIHRVGRTARAGLAGEALIFLRTHEMDFLALLREQKIPMIAEAVDPKIIRPVQAALETLVTSIFDLRQMAEAAYKTVVSAYINNRNKCFDISLLNLSSLGKNFGLVNPPHVVIKSNKPISTKNSQKRPSNVTFESSRSKIRKNK